VPDLPIAQELLRLATCRVGATSANLSGEADAVTGEEVMADFDGLLDVVVDGGRCRHGKPSTVVRATGDGVEILREGVVPAAEIREATARSLLFVCTGNRCRSPMAAAFAADCSRAARAWPRGLLESGWRIGSAGNGIAARGRRRGGQVASALRLRALGPPVAP
jgi:L-threonylcarbamoyladenylate synthase